MSASYEIKQYESIVYNETNLPNVLVSMVMNYVNVCCKCGTNGDWPKCAVCEHDIMKEPCWCVYCDPCLTCRKPSEKGLPRSCRSCWEHAHRIPMPEMTFVDDDDDCCCVIS